MASIALRSLFVPRYTPALFLLPFLPSLLLSSLTLAMAGVAGLVYGSRVRTLPGRERPSTLLLLFCGFATGFVALFSSPFSSSCGKPGWDAFARPLKKNEPWGPQNLQYVSNPDRSITF
jgi:hypothetical protein